MPMKPTVRSAARALLLWGLAAAALSLAVMLNPAGSHFLLSPCAPPTDEEAADLRREAALLLLLLSALGQALAAQVALLVPWWVLAYLAWMVASCTGLHTAIVLMRILLCPGILHGLVAVYYYIFCAILFAALMVASVVIHFGEK